MVVNCKNLQNGYFGLFHGYIGGDLTLEFLMKYLVLLFDKEDNFWCGG